MYIFLIISFVVLSVFVDSPRKSYYTKTLQIKVFCIYFYIISALIMGCRGLYIGADTHNYFQVFNRLKYYSWGEIVKGTQYAIETSYLLLMKSFDVLYIDYWGFQIFVAVIFCGTLGYLIYKYSDYPQLTTAIFLGSGLYLAAFNITRQMIAMCFIAFLFFNLLANRYTRSAIYFLLAFAFHKTAIIPGLLILFVFIIRERSALLKISPLLIFAMYPMFELLLSMFISLDALWGNAYANYIDNHKAIQTAGLSRILWIIEGGIAFAIIYDKKFNTKERIIAILSLFYIVFNMIGLIFNYAERIGIYFIFFTCLTFGIFKFRMKNKILSNIYSAATIICFLIYFYISTLTPQYKDYSFFF